MADEIIQQLGFDASAALDALAKMDVAFGSFEGRLSSVAESMAVWNACAKDTVQVLKDIAANADLAAVAMGKLHTAFGASQVAVPGQSGGGAAGAPAAAVAPAQVPKVTPQIDKTPIEEADKAAAKFIVSWETMSRVVMTQAIVRALSAIRDAMHEAFDSNLQFMTRVAEIQSIAPGVNTSLDSIAQHVAQLSREFNIPLAQVAEAQYQVLSNQFTTTAQQTEVLTAAFKLSKVAVMDAGQAVNLLSGTMNAYHMASSQAEEVAAKFFATIQIGRVRGEELASVLGRVTAVSSELGVSLDELNAMMVTLTISGVKPAEAATALRSAMMALIKPSQDLQKELRQLGFESGPQMIAALGLEGALLKLRESTDENMSAFAKLIPNVRAISGALRETDDNGRRTAEALAHLHEVSVAAFNEKYRLFIESDAQKTLTEMNKLKTFLTTDLGAAIVKVVNQFLSFAGGADAVGAAIKALVPVVLTGVAVFGSFAAVLGTMALNARLAALGLGPLGLAVNGLLVGLTAYAAFDFTNSRIIQSIRQAEDEFHRAEMDRLDMVRAASQRRIDEEDRANQEIVHKAEQTLAERRKDYFDMVDATQTDNKRLIADSHATMLKITEEADKEVHILRNLASEADRAISDSMKRSTAIAGSLADTQFRWYESQWKSGWEQQKDFAGRALSLARQAEELMSTAKTPQDIEAAQSIYKRAQAFAQESMSIAQRRKDTLGQQDAEAAIEGVLRSELTANEQLRASKQVQAKQAAQAAADEEQRVTRMRELAKAISKDMDLFDKKNHPLAGEDREKAVTKTKAGLQEFQNLMMASKKWEVSDWLNFDGMKRKMRETMEGTVTKAEVRDLFIADQSLSKLNQRITTGLGRINLDVFVGGDKSKLAGKTMEEQFKIAGDYPREQATSAKAVKDAELERADALQRIEALQGQITGNMAVQKDETVGTVQALKVGANMVTGVFGGSGKAELNAAVTMFREINETILQMRSHPLQIDPKALTDLTDKIKNLKANMPWSLDLNMSSTEANLKSLREMFDYAERLRGIQSKFPNLDQQIKGAAQGMEHLNEAIPETGKKVQETTNKFSMIQSAIDGLSLAGFIGQIEQATTAMRELAAAAGNVPSPGGGGGEMTAAHGGMAFLAGGGRPRGTDVIPAMLSPGEMVMSAATTRRFASQLTAMNAGGKPSYHSQGGHVTNVGDINVTVEGGGTGRQTARSIATELRRELRRGTSVL